MALHSAEARPEQSDSYTRRIWARLQQTERHLGEIAKIIIAGRIERVQQARRLRQVEGHVVDLREDVNTASHDLAGVDDRINDMTDRQDSMAAGIASIRAYLNLED